MSSAGPPPPSLYAELGLPATATHAELTRRFKHLSLELHPDRAAYRTNTTASEAEVRQRYQRITAAYNILADPQRRAAYDTANGANFAARVDALRAAVMRTDEATGPAPKRHCTETPHEKKDGNNGNGTEKVDKNGEEEEEEEEEYIPG
ncbi:putative chaperone [Trypanosoma theileri]|uniref:Putative chaperone n=1 Tax=Trypanosoma theileri TaxID=67003 RepID=A0A1X0NZ21_9TRYP|nr:putative chaperone [Trypanosoma theileri]ORC89798.1 putative chaperone [Trypanosoma theileri]